jgi:hypothetical protein
MEWQKKRSRAGSAVVKPENRLPHPDFSRKEGRSEWLVVSQAQIPSPRPSPRSGGEREGGAVSKHSTFNIQHSTFNIQHSTFNIQHSTFNIQHSTFNIQHSTFNIQHPTFNIQHSTFNIQR